MKEFTFDQAQAIIGAPSDPSGMTLVVRGAQRYSCGICRGDAWISPESHKAINKKRDLKVFCLNCFKAGKVRDGAGNPAKVGIPPRESLAADVGGEMADLMIRDAEKLKD